MDPKEKKYRDLQLMVENEMFTMVYLLQSLIKYQNDSRAIEILVSRLRSYPLGEIEPFFTELIFFAIFHKCAPLDSFLLELCSVDYRHFYLISTGYEIWGQYFLSLSDAYKSQIRSFLEDSETALVNGEKNVANSLARHSDPERQSKNSDPSKLLELVNLKNAKNDLKDDVRAFISYLVKLAFFLISEPRDKSKQIAVTHLQRLNIELFKRRESIRDANSKIAGMYQGVMVPFRDAKESSFIVRIIHQETKIFGTRERVPFLVFFETINLEDASSLKPDWTRDFDYLRWKYGLQINDKLREVDNKAVNDPQKVFEGLRKFEADQRNLLKKIEGISQEKFKPRGLSKSEVINRKRRNKAKAKDAQTDKKLGKMSEAEIKDKMSFLMTLLKYSTTKSISLINIEQLEKLKQALAELQSKKESADLKSEEFKTKCITIKKDSPFEHFPSYKLRAYIMKAGDDMRQESFLIHVIGLIRSFLVKEDAAIYLCDLDFILFSKTAAIIEYLPNHHSIDHLKKIYKEKSLCNIFKIMFAKRFEEAQKNFVSSLAGYSFVCYLFNIKDRHNGNIMIGPEGHIVHIDFGFALNYVPGNVNFESAPFKLTQDYLDIMGGDVSPLFYFYKSLIIRAFNVIKKYADVIWASVEIMMNSDLPCFFKFDLKSFKDRFHRFMSDHEREKLIDGLVTSSANNSRTTMYDRFQKYSNGIEM